MSELRSTHTEPLKWISLPFSPTAHTLFAAVPHTSRSWVVATAVGVVCLAHALPFQNWITPSSPTTHTADAEAPHTARYRLSGGVRFITGVQVLPLPCVISPVAPTAHRSVGLAAHRP